MLNNFRLCFNINITKGHERLVQALSDMYSKLINRKIDPFKEILITCGAYEALYSTIRGFVVEIGLKFIIVSHITYLHQQL